MPAEPRATADHSASAGFTGRACPFCGATGHSTPLFLFTVRQYFDASPYYSEALREHLGLEPGQSFGIERCGCGFVFAPLLPSADFLDRLYGFDAAPGTDAAGPGTSTAVMTRPDWAGGLLKTLGEALNLVAARRPGLPVRVLDIGCSYGLQLCALSRPDFPYQCVGVETNPAALAYLEREGIRVHASIEELMANEQGHFHLIILNEILEHVPDPRTLLSRASSFMNPDSLLWIGVPDYGRARVQSITHDVQAGALPPLDLNPWEHLNYFTPQTLDAMCSQQGLHRVPVDVAVNISSRVRGRRVVPALLRMHKRFVEVVTGRQTQTRGFYELRN